MCEQIHLTEIIEYTATVEDVSIVFIVEQFTNKGDELARVLNHTHAYNELFVCLSGRLKIDVSGTSVTLNPGDSAIIPANLFHHITFKSPATIWCSLGFSITKKQCASACKFSDRLIKLCNIEKILLMNGFPEFCEKIYSLVTDFSYPYDCVPAIELILLLAKNAEKFTNTEIRLSKTVADSDISRFVLIGRIVDTEFTKQINPKSIADSLHISTRQLARIVKNRYGTTLTQVIINKRIETAEKLLADTERTVADIADLVGFSSTAFMHRKFKEKNGMTPVEYRNSFRNQTV